MPKLIYLVTEDWFFASHFLPMARAARAAGFDVVVATRVRRHGERIAAEGFRVVSLEGQRRSTGPFELAGGFSRTLGILRSERPDIVHCIALRTVVLGGLAARMAGIRRIVLAPTGLGHLWVEDSATARLGRKVIRTVAGRTLHKPGTRYLFENRDDPREFGLDPDGPEVTIVPGAGVDPDVFTVTPEPPAPPVRVAVVARMLRAKGIETAVEATRRARARGAPVELDLYGLPDGNDSRSHAEGELRDWSAEPGIDWKGATGDVPEVWRSHHIAMLLTTYREGLPRTLLESAAAGRPAIATDVPGCREIIRDGGEGLLVPPGDVDAAAEALVRLAGDGALRGRLGAGARRRVTEKFSEAEVMRIVTRLYLSMMTGSG